MKKEERLQDYNKIINFIIEEIDNGKLIEGSRLPSERELTEMLETSRNSTREAISILRGMGLVESRLGSGNYIVNNSEKTVKYMVDVMLKMGSITTKEIIDYRRFISRAVGTELAENGISQEYEEQLERIIESMRDASDEEFCRWDREFHLTLINATENKLFMTVMEPIGELYLDIIVDVIMTSTDIDRKTRVPMHENILRSIQSKDIEACIRSMQAHYDYVESKFDF